MPVLQMQDIQVKIKVGPHATSIPRGMETLIARFLVATRCFGSGLYKVHLGGTIRPKAGKPEIRVVKWERNAIFLETQTGESDSGRTCRLMLKGRVNAPELFRQMRETAQLLYFPREAKVLTPEKSEASEVLEPAASLVKTSTAYAKLAEYYSDPECLAVFTVSLEEILESGPINRKNLEKMVVAQCTGIGEIDSKSMSCFIQRLIKWSVLDRVVSEGGVRAIGYAFGARGHEICAKHGRKSPVFAPTVREPTPPVPVDDPVLMVMMVRERSEAYVRAKNENPAIGAKIENIKRQIAVLEEEGSKLVEQREANDAILSDPEYQRAPILWAEYEQIVASVEKKKT